MITTVAGFITLSPQKVTLFKEYADETIHPVFILGGRMEMAFGPVLELHFRPLSGEFSTDKL
jgi:hypothetical protein